MESGTVFKFLIRKRQEIPRKADFKIYQNYLCLKICSYSLWCVLLLSWISSNEGHSLSHFRNYEIYSVTIKWFKDKLHICVGVSTAKEFMCHSIYGGTRFWKLIFLPQTLWPYEVINKWSEIRKSHYYASYSLITEMIRLEACDSSLLVSGDFNLCAELLYTYLGIYSDKVIDLFKSVYCKSCKINKSKPGIWSHQGGRSAKHEET